MANPLHDLLRGFDVLREQVRQGMGGDADWLDRLDPRKPPEDTRTLEELQAELDSLVGLDTVKEQVRALVAFLQVQARRQEHGLPEVATSPAPRLPRQPGHRQDDRRPPARADVPRDGAAQAGAPRRGRPRGARRPVRRADRDQDRPRDPAGARRRALHRRGLRARAARGDGGSTSAPEAVETLLKRMEDHRHRLVVIVAGYPRLMRALPRLEPGSALPLRARDRRSPTTRPTSCSRSPSKLRRPRTSTALDRDGRGRRCAGSSTAPSAARASATRATRARSSSRR